MEAGKERETIVLTKQTIDRQDSIGIEYVNNQATALQFSPNSNISDSRKRKCFYTSTRFPAFGFIYPSYSPRPPETLMQEWKNKES